MTYARFPVVAGNWCPGRDLNPHSACAKKDFKSFASADFATRAFQTSATYCRLPDRPLVVLGWLFLLHLDTDMPAPCDLACAFVVLGFIGVNGDADDSSAITIDFGSDRNASLELECLGVFLIREITPHRQRAYCY